jgi:hypothetical protein
VQFIERDRGQAAHLGPLSLQRVRDEFMEIEEPEAPLDFPVHALTEAAEARLPSRPLASSIRL